jgi:hypothetical protein
LIQNICRTFDEPHSIGQNLCAEVLVTYYVLFFIHLKSRKVDIAGITVIGGISAPTHATPSGLQERA